MASDGSTAMKALHVLVVDDCPDMRSTMLLVLRAWGFEACDAGDGGAALRVAQAFCPDVVLLDLGLPGMDGYEVARRLRELPGLAETRLIALTGFGRTEDIQRCREAGIEKHLLKPIEPIRLRQLLESTVQ